jgi:phage terminase large subunit-like protein
MKLIKAAEKYINDVISGEELVSKTTRKTFIRHKNDLRIAPEQGWYFDKTAVEKVFDFCTLLHHSPDKRSWEPFTPEPWQAAIIYIVYGWKNADGTRRFNYAYIEVPKKNGKTTFAAVFANYMLFFDGENEGEVYCAATVEKQARICFDMAKKMVEHSPALKSRSRILTKNVNIPGTGSKMEMLGRDSDSMEGMNPSAAIIDEYHVWKNNEVFENIQSATVNRSQPLIFVITTSGRDKTLPCFDYRKLCLDILDGVKTQDDTFVIIYTPDTDDDWKDERAWKKANPNMGVSVRPDRFRKEFNGALNDGRKEVSFKTKNLDIWVDAPTIWIPDDKFVKCSYGITQEDITGKQCYAGLDLASHVDINALGLFFPRIKGHPVARMYYWIPEKKVEEKKDIVDYRTWVNEGRIIATPGDVIDIDYMLNDMFEIFKIYLIEGLAFDPYLAHHGTIQGLKKGGFPDDKLDPYPQNIKNMSPPSKEYEKMILSGILDHMDCPVLRWMMRNVVVYEDINENIKPDKKKSREKIDGVVAIINAIGEWLTLTSADEQRQIYKTHSLRFV